MDKTLFQPNNSIKLPEMILQSLIDMEEYDDFCTFFYYKCKAIKKCRLRKFSYSSLLNQYFNQK